MKKLVILLVLFLSISWSATYRGKKKVGKFKYASISALRLYSFAVSNSTNEVLRSVRLDIYYDPARDSVRLSGGMFSMVMNRRNRALFRSALSRYRLVGEQRVVKVGNVSYRDLCLVKMSSLIDVEGKDIYLFSIQTGNKYSTLRFSSGGVKALRNLLSEFLISKKYMARKRKFR